MPWSAKLLHAEKLGTRPAAIPLSAIKGENVVHRAAAMPWYSGPTLLEFLETVEVDSAVPEKFAFPVQRVSRPNSEFRGYQGTVAGGRVRVGDPIVAVPSGQARRVQRIATFDGNLDEASTGEAITLVLADEIEAGRGTIFAHPEAAPAVVESLTAHLVWMGEAALDLSRSYLLRTPSGTRSGAGERAQASSRCRNARGNARGDAREKRHRSRRDRRQAARRHRALHGQPQPRGIHPDRSPQQRNRRRRCGEAHRAAGRMGHIRADVGA